MESDPVPILEQGVVEGATPGGYNGPSPESLKEFPHRARYTVAESRGVVSLHASEPSVLLLVLGWATLTVAGISIPIIVWKLENTVSYIAISIGAFAVIAAPLAARTVHRHQCRAHARGPVLEFDRKAGAVHLTRTAETIPLDRALAVERVCKEVHIDSASEEQLVQSLVLVFRREDGLVDHREVAVHVENPRMVADDLCRALGVGLHDIWLSKAKKDKPSATT